MIRVTNRPYSFYGSFSDTRTQTTASVNVRVPMLFNTVEESQGITITSGSQINILNAGTYNIQFSAQLQKSNSSAGNAYVWLSKNGNADYAWSNGAITLSGNSKAVTSWNYVVTFTGGDHFHLFWLADDTNISILSASAPGSGMPEIPSVALTVTQV
jgi:hypothetical protein